jgi:hypothetical protein
VAQRVQRLADIADRAVSAAFKVLNKAMIDTTPEDRVRLRRSIETQFHVRLQEARPSHVRLTGGSVAASSTGRIYARAQSAFQKWCQEQQIADPGHEDIANYLLACLALRGPGPVAVHLSAIADLYRSQGQVLDTKSQAIQDVMIAVRKKKKDRHDSLSSSSSR